MRRYWMMRGAKFLVWAVAGFAVIGLVVMALWNWLMPALLGAPEIGFLQAVALLVLSRILFGGLRGPFGWGSHWRHRMQARWERMTPEERENFRAGFRRHCGWRKERADPVETAESGEAAGSEPKAG